MQKIDSAMMNTLATLRQPIAHTLKAGTSEAAIGSSAKTDSFSPSEADKALSDENIQETSKDWERQGKKLGMFGVANLGVALGPGLVATVAPAFLSSYSGPIGIGLGILAVGLEEKYIGAGKFIGGKIAKAAGFAAGSIREHFKPAGAPSDSPVELPMQKPTGAKAKEPLLPSILHTAQKKIFGEEYVPNADAQKMGSMVTTLVSALSFLAAPIAGAFVGGPVGCCLATLAGGVLGNVVGSVEENLIGAGKFMGEAVGGFVGLAKKGIAKISPSAVKKYEKAAKEGEINADSNKFLISVNNIISEPIMGTLMDANAVGNKLFVEKPVQTVNFLDRPIPEVKRDRLVANFIKLAGINATSGKEAPVTEELKNQLDMMGIAYNVRPEGTIIATIPGTIKDAPTVLLSAHQDTVSPTSAESIKNDGRTIHTNEKNILGGDDRAGIAEILEGVRTVFEKGYDRPEIKIVFTVDEETGAHGAQKLNPEDISDRPTLGFVVDATDKSDLFLTIDGSHHAEKPAGYNFSQEDPIVQIAMRSMARAGITPRPIHAPPIIGAHSDANTTAFNSKHIKSITVGTGVANVHTGLEYAKINDMEQVAKSVAGYISNACDYKVAENGKIEPRYPQCQ
ncbi:MAG: M20/M25/M40 family metallo-hydrolase [Firmicutes bacterium]|nr:M20/M25/M40 family metallo-hydrolase [Bacillota bacterium]